MYGKRIKMGRRSNHIGKGFWYAKDFYLTLAQKEFSWYDYFVINDELETASDDVLTIIRALDFSHKRMNNFISEVIDNV